MATVSLFGPYHFVGNIPPRQARNIKWGPHPAFDAGTIYVSGHPATNQRNNEHAMWVSDQSTAKTDIGFGDINNVQSSYYATFFNSSQPGGPTITAWAAYISKIAA